MTRRVNPAALLTMLALASAGALGGCTAPSGDADVATSAAAELSLAYSPNVTQGPALVGLAEGFVADARGETALSTEIFGAGPAMIEAISAGAIDAAFVGPSPSINTYIKSGGQSATIVAGATNGGAALVVRNGIDQPADLVGTTLASPQLGNTQDLALRTWLADEGFETSIEGGGDVTITPTDNADTFTLFRAGQLDGAWLPEPWVSRLIIDGGAHVLVDEADLWQGGVFSTTVLLVNQTFLAEHPQTVAALLEAHVDAVNWLNENPDDAASVINARIAADTGTALSEAVIASALESVEFSFDPLADTFPTLADRAAAAGTGTAGDVTGLFDLRLLNEILIAEGAEPVSAYGLGEE